MSGLEVIGLIIGLEPLLAQAKDLVTRYKTYKANRRSLSLPSLTSFNAQLSDTISTLQQRSKHLPVSTRDIVLSDVQTLIKHLQQALHHTIAIEHYSESRLTQFFRAKSLAEQFDNLFIVLEKAEALVRQATKFMEIMKTLHHQNDSESSHDHFRACFPQFTESHCVLLQFDERGDDGNPVTVEGRIRDMVTAQAGRRRILAIHGTAGVGKSTMINGLVHDPIVREVFTDGVHLITLGMDATATTLFQALCKILADSGAAKTEASLHSNNKLEDAMDKTLSWFRERRCAFFIDDVWSKNIGIAPIAKLCRLADTHGENVVVITSRQHEVVAVAPCENVVRVDPREPLGFDSRRMLFLHAELEETESTDELDDCVNQVLTVCGGLPVALAAAGKVVKMMRISMGCPEVVVWKRYVSNLQTSRERLIAENVDTYGNLLATFAASLAILDEDQFRTVDLGTKLPFDVMHRSLCVLQRKGKVPVSMLRHLWEVASDAQAEMIAMRFVQIGLANSESEKVGSEWLWRLSMHDSLYDFAAMNARRNDDTNRAHERLVQGYARSVPALSAEDGSTKWWVPELLPDGYIHENICRHLYEAGQVKELVRLLLTPEWIARRLEVNDVMSLEADFLIGIKAVREQIRETAEGLEQGLELILAALRLSSGFISRDSRQIWFQLQGRLLVHAETNAVIAEYLTKACRFAKKPWMQCLNSFLVPSGGATTRIFTVDSAPQCITILPGKRIACGCSDGTILVFGLTNWAVEKEWQAHEHTVTAITTWNDLLVTASQDSTAKLWNVSTGDCLKTFEGHSGWVTSAVVTMDGRLVTGSADGSTRIWNMGGEVVMGPYMNNGPVWSVASLEDGRIISAGMDRIVRIWSPSGDVVGLAGHEDWIRCLAVSSDGNIISGSNDGTVRRWSHQPVRQIGEMRHADYVSCLYTCGGRIVSGGHDRTIRVWEDSKLTRTLVGHRDWVSGVLLFDDTVVSCSLDGTIRVWGIHDAGEPPDHEPRAIHSVTFTSDGRAITGSADGVVRVWDGGVVRGAFEGHGNVVTGVASRGELVASVSRDRTLRIWELSSGRSVEVLTGHGGWVLCVDWVDDDTLITGSRDGCMRIWNIQDGSSVAVACDNTVTQVFALGERVISVTLQGRVTVYRFGEGGVVALRVVVFEHAWKVGRREIMELVGEGTYDGAVMVRGGRDVTFRGAVLASLEGVVRVWDCWRDDVAVGLRDGGLAFMKLVRDRDGMAREL